MANDCKAQIFACAMRVARLEANGVPDPGANNLIVTDSLVQFVADPEIATGSEVEVRNACDDVCLNFKAPDKLKRLNVSMDICKVDPELYELLVGGKVLTQLGAVGYAYPPLGTAEATRFGVSIELWAKRVDESGVQDPTFGYNWWVFPKVELQIGSRTFENGPFGNPFNGQAVENPNWFDGPENDWTEDSDRVAQFMPTNVIPTPSCGYRTLAVS